MKGLRWRKIREKGDEVGVTGGTTRALYGPSEGVVNVTDKEDRPYEKGIYSKTDSGSRRSV